MVVPRYKVVKERNGRYELWTCPMPWLGSHFCRVIAAGPKKVMELLKKRFQEIG